MKTELSTEQTKSLAELGVEAVTLTDVLSILPKWIKYRNMLLWLIIRVDQYEEHWCCAYQGGTYDCDEADTLQSSEELIDALYELLVNCIEDKLITFK